MTDVKLLKAKMVMLGDEDFVKVLAELLEITRQTAAGRLNNESRFLQTEIAIISKHYGLTSDDIKKIFVDGGDGES